MKGPSRDWGSAGSSNGVHPPAAGDADAAVAMASDGADAPPVGDARASSTFLSMVAHEYARRHLVLGLADGRLLRAERTSPLVVFNISSRLAMAGAPVTNEQVVPGDELASLIDAAYAEPARSDESGDAPTGGQGSETRSVIAVEIDDPEHAGDGIASAVAAAVRAADQDLLHTSGKPPSVRLVDLILFEAVRRGASDVHVQPTRDRTLVRYRLDGSLRTVRELPASLAAAVVGRIKVMGQMDIAERRAPQDGRATVSIGGAAPNTSPTPNPASDPPPTGAPPRTGPGPAQPAPGPARVDLRISTLPSAYGERVVVRLLDPARSKALLTLSALGMPDAERVKLESFAARPSGIILSTGPTGSGKTTTLYALLAWITATSGGSTASSAHAATDLNALTIEDPIEYDLSPLGVSQTQVDAKKGLSFAAGLRHILRQDPDVIMVGEIRDEETARIAVQASLTGHLVLSTLHTNDAASAIARLIDLGVEPFLVCSSLTGVLAQRLVRRVHAACRGHGCEACLGSGYKGRTGVFELLEVTPEIREIIASRAPSDRIAAQATRQGMTSLREAGRGLVAAGVTTSAEVARAITVTDEEVV